MKKRLLSLFLCFVMLLSLVPTSVHAASGYQLWIGSVQVTPDNASDVLGNGTVSYDPYAGELTINGLSLTDASYDGAIYLKSGDLTVNVKGQNRISLPSSSGKSAIYTYGAITLIGDGDLTIELADSYGDGIHSGSNSPIAVDMDGDLDISVNAFGITGNGVTLSGDGNVTVQAYRGISSSGSVTVSGGGDLDVSASYAGIYANGGSFVHSGSGDLTVSATSSSGIYSRDDAVFSGSGNVDVHSDNYRAFQGTCGLILSGTGTVSFTSDKVMAATVYYSDSSVLLNGTSPLILFRAGGTNPAILNESTRESPVGGTALPSYLRTGSPAESSVSYTRTCEYPLWVDDVRVTSSNAADVLGDGTVSYNQAKKALTVNGLSLTHASKDSAIYAEDDLTLIVKGKNEISLPSGGDSGAVFSAGNLTLTGSGDLTIDIPGSGRDGLRAGDNADLTVDMNGKLGIYVPNRSMVGRNVILSGKGNVQTLSQYGISAEEGVTISGSGIVDINSYDTGIEANSSAFCYFGSGDLIVDTDAIGIYSCDTAVLSGRGDVTVGAGFRAFVGDGSLTLSGSGAFSFTSKRAEAVSICGADNAVLLNGTSKSVTFKAADTFPAVVNETTGGSPVAGTELSHYALTGSPSESSVTYTRLKEYPVWVCGERVTSLNADDVLGDGTVIFDVPTGTLTLDGASLTVSGGPNSAAAINAAEDITIQLVNDNTISLDSGENAGSGIYLNESDVNLTGYGSLTVDVPWNGIFLEGGSCFLYNNDAVSLTTGGCGIYASQGGAYFYGNGDLTIRSGDTAINANEAIALNGNGDIDIISSGEGVTAEEGNLRIKGSGSKTIVSGGNGLCAPNGEISVGGDGDLTIESDSHGICGVSVQLGGSGDVSVDSANEAVYVSGDPSNEISGVLDICGSGAVTLTANTEWGGVVFFGEDSAVELNGTASPITITGSEGYSAIFNNANYSSPVTGNNIGLYHMTGDPAGNKVTYTYSDPVANNLWVDGVEVTSANADDVLGNGTVSYDPDTNTLTLDGACLTAMYSGECNAAIYVVSDLNVDVTGSSTIELAEDREGCGIYAEGDLTLIGGGDLFVTGAHVFSNGILSTGSITVDMDGDLTVAAGNYAIHADGDFLYCGSGALSTEADFGIASDGDAFTFDGSGDVTLIGKDSVLECYAGDLTIGGSGSMTVTATAGYAVYVDDGSLILCGEGDVSLVSEIDTAVKIWGNDSAVLLDGTAEQITITAGDECHAVLNGDTSGSPVSGTNRSRYQAFGDPAGSTVTYVITGSYGIWVNGVQIDGINKDDVLGDGTVSYDPDENVLTLDGAYITETAMGAPDYSAAIYADTDLIMNVVGDSTIDLAQDTEGYAILSRHIIAMEGNGDLTVTVRNDSFGGIVAMEELFLNMNGDLDVTTEWDSITAYGDLIYFGSGDITVTGGYNTFYTAYGDMELAGSGTVLVTGDEYGLVADTGSITISGSGAVSVTTCENDAVYVNGGDLILSGSGPISFESENDRAVVLWTEDSVVRLNGSASPVVFTTGADTQAVYSYGLEDGENPVTGTNRSAYELIGDPLGSVATYLYRGAYDLWVNGEQVTYGNAADVLGDGTVSYDPASHTLTLDGAALTTAIGEGWEGAIYAKTDLVVNVAGDSTIELPEDEAGYGIYNTRTLMLTGEGDLDITVPYEYYDGIWTEGDLILSMDGDLTVSAAEDGINTGGLFLYEGSGDLTVDSHYGIYAYGAITIAGSGDVTVSGEEYVLEVDGGDLTVSGSGDLTVTAATGCAAYMSIGDLILSGSGSVTLTSENSFAVYCDTKDTAVLLNGTAVQIAITAGGGKPAVMNGDTGESPVGGVNFAAYSVTGDPAGSSVIYTYTDYDVYDLWVGGEQVTDLNLNDVLGDGTVSYDPDENVLTLDGAFLTETRANGYGYDTVIFADGDLTVNVEGDSTFDTTAAGEDDCSIYTGGDLTISGDGDLTFTTNSDAIIANGDFLYSGSGDLTVDSHYGIYADGTITITGSGDVTVSGDVYVLDSVGNITVAGSGDLTVTAEYGYAAYVDLGDLILSGSGSVTIVSKGDNAVKIWGSARSVLLNGTAAQVTLTGGGGKPAVMNGDTHESPVGGTNFAKYSVTGSPAESSVVYTYSTVDFYDLWVDGEQVTSLNRDDVLGDGTVSYDPDENVLTLDGACITAVYDGGYEGAVYTEGDLTVDVVGDSVIKLPSSVYGYGIYADGDLTLTGDGDLEISISNFDCGGIRSGNGDLVIAMDGDLTVCAHYEGIRAGENLLYSGSGDLTVDSYYGIRANKSATLDGSGDVNVTVAYYALESYDGGVVISGSGDVNMTAEEGCTVFLEEGDLDLRGSGAFAVTSKKDIAVYIFTENTFLLLNGSGDVSLTSSDEFRAIQNVSDSPVGGTSLADYHVIGAPDEPSVLYTLSDTYGVWVNGEQVTLANLSDVLGDGTVSYDPAKKELTLDGAFLTETRANGYGYDAAIYAEDELVVNVAGDSTIDTSEVVCEYDCGIYTENGLIISGDGDLTVNGNSDAVMTYGDFLYSGSGDLTVNSHYGIYASGAITIAGSGSVTANGMECVLEADGGDLTVSGSGDLTVTAATGCAAYMSTGDLILSGSGSVTIVSKGDNAVKIWGSARSVLLNGTAAQVTLTGGGGKPAVMNGDTGESPVGGTNFARYSVTGDPADSAVTYSYAGPYDLWVNGEQVTFGNKDDVLGDGTVSYDPAKKELTLDGAFLTAASNGGSCAAIYAEDGLTVNVAGDSTIELTDGTPGDGIFASGDLTLTGDGDLSIRVDPTYWYDGIRAYGSTVLDLDGDLTVEGPDDGVYAEKNLTVTGDGTIRIRSNYGFYAAEFTTLSGSGDIDILTVYTGIYADNGLFSDMEGDLTVTSEQSEALCAYDTVTIAASGDTDLTSQNDSGVYLDGDLILSGTGTVTITSDTYYAVELYDYPYSVLLNGTASPVTITSADGLPAVYDDETGESPVGGTNFAGYTVTGDPADSTVTYTCTAAASISGLVESINPKAPLTLTLMRGTEKIAELVLPNDDTAYAAKMPFSFEGIAPGTYTLIAEKITQLSATVSNITITDGDVDVGTLKLASGDLNGDTYIDALDITILASNLMVATSFEEGDLNGDGFIDSLDITILDFNLLSRPVSREYGA